MAELTTVQLNNFILLLKPKIEAARLTAVQKLTKLSKKLKTKFIATDKEKQSSLKRADNYYQQIMALKKMSYQEIGKFLTLNKHSTEKVLADPDSAVELKALVRVSANPEIAKKIEQFRQEFPNWSKELPDLIKSLGVNRRKKLLVGLRNTEIFDKFVEKEWESLVLLDKLVGLDLDPKLLKLNLASTKKEPKSTKLGRVEAEGRAMEELADPVVDECSVDREEKQRKSTKLGRVEVKGKAVEEHNVDSGNESEGVNDVESNDEESEYGNEENISESVVDGKSGSVGAKRRNVKECVSKLGNAQDRLAKDGKKCKKSRKDVKNVSKREAIVKNISKTNVDDENVLKTCVISENVPIAEAITKTVPKTYVISKNISKTDDFGSTDNSFKSKQTLAKQKTKRCRDVLSETEAPISPNKLLRGENLDSSDCDNSGDELRCLSEEDKLRCMSDEDEIDSENEKNHQYSATPINVDRRYLVGNGRIGEEMGDSRSNGGFGEMEVSDTDCESKAKRTPVESVKRNRNVMEENKKYLACNDRVGKERKISGGDGGFREMEDSDTDCESEAKSTSVVNVGSRNRSVMEGLASKLAKFRNFKSVKDTKGRQKLKRSKMNKNKMYESEEELSDSGAAPPSKLRRESSGFRGESGGDGGRWKGGRGRTKDGNRGRGRGRGGRNGNRGGGMEIDDVNGFLTRNLNTEDARGRPSNVSGRLDTNKQSNFKDQNVRNASSDANLHPSWTAKIKQLQCSTLVQFEGKRKTFD